MLKVILVAVTIMLGVTACVHDLNRKSTYDQYQQKCAEVGGIVVGAEQHFASVEYKCIGATPNELLPRMLSP